MATWTDSTSDLKAAASTETDSSSDFEAAALAGQISSSSSSAEVPDPPAATRTMLVASAAAETWKGALVQAAGTGTAQDAADTPGTPAIATGLGAA